MMLHRLYPLGFPPLLPAGHSRRTVMAGQPSSSFIRSSRMILPRRSISWLSAQSAPALRPQDAAATCSPFLRTAL